MKAEINKQIELVQVLLYLTEEQGKTYQHLENKKYANAISGWFSQCRNHPAISLTRELVVGKNFVHIRPLRAILSLEDILSNPNHELYPWGLSVKDFERDARFDDFFESQREYYQWILDRIALCDFDTWIGFIDNYFRRKPGDFKLVICPINGNYGFTMQQGGCERAYTVRCMPKYDAAGNAHWEYDMFAMGVAHEYAHCFVNPVVEGNVHLLEAHRQFFDAHRDIPNFYNTDYAVINEYFVRAFQIRFMDQNRAIFPDFDHGKEYARQKNIFIFIDRFLDALKQFEKQTVDFGEFYASRIEGILSADSSM